MIHTKFNFPLDVVPVNLCSDVIVTVNIICERDECSFIFVQDWDRLRSDTDNKSATSAFDVTGTCVNPGT